MEERSASVKRTTRETQISLTLNLDGSGQAQIDTGIGFFDHMLQHVAFQALFDLSVQAHGDLQVDAHHTVEDVAIGFGQALAQALGERSGLCRMGHAYVPMDEALARVVIDLSGRPFAQVEATFSAPMLGTMPSTLVAHALEAIAVNGRLALHACVLYGRDDHHKAEALFKALGRALGVATRLDERRAGIPSTKGVLV